MSQAGSDDRRKVLFYISSLGKGGAERHLVRVANFLDPSRFQVSIAVNRTGGAYEQELSDKVALRDLKVPWVPRAIGPLRSLIQRERPHVVCPVMDRQNCVALAAVRGLKDPPPVVPLVQNNPFANLRVGFTNRIVLKLIPLLYPGAAHVVALSRGVEESVLKLAPSLRGRTSVIYNAGLDPQVASLADEPFEAPDRDPNERLVVACGRLHEQKGFVHLLAAFARVREKLPCRLWIMGEGALLEFLQGETRRLGIEQSVWFGGFRGNPYPYMKAGDLFVLSSLWEGFGNVIVEAMAVGTAVVSTACPFGPDEIITDGENGLLVPPANPEALANAMIRVLEDDPLRARLRDAGLRRAEDFTAQETAQRYGELLLSVARSAHGP